MRTLEEWSTGFDLYWNNIMSNKAPGLNEYEKSVFLTHAQKNVVLQLYNGSAREPFESSEEITRYLSSLVKQGIGSTVSDSSYPKIVSESYLFKLNPSVMFITYESCTLSVDSADSEAIVVPVTQDNFWKVHRDPFKCENRNRVLRLAYSVNDAMTQEEFNTNGISELISKYPISEYRYRYLSVPSPIILVDLLDTGLSIDDQNEALNCEMPEVLHETILLEAVRLAKSAWSSTNQ